MERIDARKVDRETLRYLRKRCVKLRESGMSNKEVAEILGVAKETTSKWYSLYRKGGSQALKVQKRGRPEGSCKKLSPEQERRILSLLVEKNPRQLEFPFALWTRESVQALIERELQIHLPLSTVGLYLDRWRMSSKKPIKRAYERKDTLAKAWLEEEYPKIRKEAKAQKAEIWWADETSCLSLPNNLKGYAPVGKKPILEHTAKKFRLNMISAITPTGKSMFALYDHPIDTERFLDFLQRAIDSAQKKIFMILDNLRVHHAKKVKAWVEEHKEKIELFYLPAYSPDLNPDEYLNQDYKQSANRNRIPKNKKELEANTIAYMESLRRNPRKVQAFFQHESVRYAV